MHLDAKHCLNVVNFNVRKQLSRKKGYACSMEVNQLDQQR